MDIMNAVIHSVDHEQKTVVLSKQQINLSENKEFDTFVIKLLRSLKNSVSSSKARLNDASILKSYIGVPFDFMSVATHIATQWFDTYTSNALYTSCNLIFAFVDNGDYAEFCMFEVMSRYGFLKVVDDETNTIKQNSGVLIPSYASIKTAFTLNLENGDMLVKHQGETQEILERILDFETLANAKKSIEVLNSVVDYLSTKRDDEGVFNAIKSKQRISEDAELFEEVEPTKIIESVFESLNEEERTFIKESFEANNMLPLIESDQITRLSGTKKHRIKTENGIEIIIPIDSLDIDQVLEIETDAFHRIHIHLKNVGKLV